MNKNIFTLIFSLPIFVFGQTQTENYIKNTTYKQATTTTISTPDISVANVNISYFDGLGRPIQQIAHKQSSTGKDIVSHIEYDEFGRQVKEFLPFTNSSASLNYNSNAGAEQLTYYNNVLYENTTNPYSEKQFESSPLNRVLKQSAPGNDWSLGSGHEIKLDYNLNSVSDSVINFKANRVFSTTIDAYNYTLGCLGYWNQNTLYKNVTKDENWTSGSNNTVEEYKDNLGRVILKRAYNNSQKHDTYYVYDVVGNLCYVLPPKVIDNIVQIQSNSVPYTYTQGFGLSSFLIDTNGNPITSGGGGMSISIQNSTISLSFNMGYSGLATFDLTKEHLINAINPIPDMTLGYVDFNYNGNHQYIAVIQGNKLKFLDYTPSTPPFQFTSSFIGQNLSQPLNPSQFGSTTVYTYVLNNTLMNGLNYQYKYDQRNRLVEKKLPGKQWEFIVYDKLDRVVATGPALSPFTTPSGNGWMITKYDVFNRVVYTGWSSLATINSDARKNFQAQYNAETTNFSETKTATTTNTTISGVALRYSNVAIPTSGYHILTVNYYDDYNFPHAPTSIPTDIEGQTVYYNTTIKPKGLLTGSYIRVLESATTYNAETNYTLYDSKARPIRSYKANYLGGFTQVDTKLDFIGKTNYTITTHKRLSSSLLIKVKDEFTYTAQDRLLTHTHQINDGDIQLLTKNEYDELGQLIVKRVGGTDVTGNTSLQKVDYTYNIRGWLKEINKVDNLNIFGEPEDLFSFKINYNHVEDEPTYTGTKLYNGNISETYWRTANDNKLRKYGYQYDNLNRLTNAIYQKPSSAVVVTNSYNESLSYDKNGNITALQRTGEFDDSYYNLTIDNLTYNYNSVNPNQLDKVDDATNNPNGFKDGTNTSKDYTYDDYGNMKTDENKEIYDIRYNHLNLPTNIETSQGKISYLYNAVGVKLMKNVLSTNPTLTTDYLDGFQYLNSVLEFFPHAEGYVKNTILQGVNSYNYVFNYTDHLGNIRLSYGIGEGNDLKIFEEINYYPFGLNHKNYNMDQRTYQSFLGQTVRVCNSCPTGYKYKYNGKELQDELGLNLYDYGARNYDPAIGRWMSIDPLAEKYFGTTLYNYVLNNPVIGTDPNGMDVYLINEDGQTILALKEKNKKTDTLYAVKNNTITNPLTKEVSKFESTLFQMKDTNGDGKKDAKDGVTVKAGLIGQLTKSSGEDTEGIYSISVGRQEGNENDYLSLFKYISDNSMRSEFSLAYYTLNNQNWMQLGTYNKYDVSPGVKVKYGKTTKSYHNHSDTIGNQIVEFAQMGAYPDGRYRFDGRANDFHKSIEEDVDYTKYVYYASSKNLYSVTKYTVKYVQKINSVQDLKQ